MLTRISISNDHCTKGDRIASSHRRNRGTFHHNWRPTLVTCDSEASLALIFLCKMVKAGKVATSWISSSVAEKRNNILMVGKLLILCSASPLVFYFLFGPLFCIGSWVWQIHIYAFEERLRKKD